MFSWFSIVLGTVFSLLPISNPLSSAALFLAITKGYSRAEKKEQATRACIYMGGILLLFFAAGALIMKFFGISLPAVQIAGGLIVAKVGFSMMNPVSFAEVAPESKKAAEKKADVAFTPLAMPSLSGPGSIAVVIGLTPKIDFWWEYFAIALGILIVAGIAWTVLRTSDKLMRFIGVAGLNAFTRVMGFILVCVGIQFVAQGMEGFLRHPPI